MTRPNGAQIIPFPRPLESVARRLLPVREAECAEANAWLDFTKAVRRHHAERSLDTLIDAINTHGRWSTTFLVLEQEAP